jgi:lambda family phage portal protein
MSNDFSTTASPPFEAAGQGRRLRGWQASAAGPNNTVSGSLDVLRRRSRDAVRNSSTANGIITAWVRALVGYGIAARPMTDNPTLKAKLTGLWEAWATVADSDGGNLNGLQQLAVHAWLESGEVFIRLRPRLPSDGLPVPLQLQIMESESVPLLDADTYPGLSVGNTIRQGIEANGIGQRVAYWVWKSHPGDRAPSTIAANDLVRVPVENMVHLFEPTRPGQLRGVPLLAPILATLRAMDDFTDATLERQRISNLFAMFITRPIQSGGDDPLTGLPAQYDSTGPVTGLEPGTSQELLPGEDVKFSDPPGAAAEYDAYIRRQMLAMTSGAGLPYEIASGDLKDVSDRSLRIAVNEWRRGCEQRQWNVIIPRLLTPIRNAWCAAAALSGALAPTEATEALRVNWAPPAWAYMHPTQDVERAKIEVDAGFRSRASVIAEMGFDPAAVDQERAADAARAADLGLMSEADAAAKAELAKVERTAKMAKLVRSAARE